MNPETLLLRFFVKDKENYLKYNMIMSNIILDKEFASIYKTICKYYEAIPTHNYISLDEFINFFLINQNLNKDKDIIIELTKQIYSVDVSDSLILEVIKNLVEKDVANKIINKLLPVLTENKFGVLSSVDEDIKQYLNTISKQEKETPFEESSFEELLESHVTGEGLSWRLDCLNNDIGVIRGGYLGHLFARTDTGKTSFLCSELSHMATQLKEDDGDIIWFGNEENVGRIKLRLYSALLNESMERIINNKDKAKELFIAKGGERIKFVGQATHLQLIKNTCFEYPPSLIIIDSGDKVAFSGDSKYEGTGRLGELYWRYRQLIDEFNIPCLTVGQASADAAGKKWLEMGMLENSKTSKPKEMDFIIGLGRTLDGEDDGLRYINIPKNKLNGGNGKHTIKFNQKTSRFIDI